MKSGIEFVVFNHHFDVLFYYDPNIFRIMQCNCSVVALTQDYLSISRHCLN
ncbi:MAG: hypothetical protein JXA00_06740 [Candidatus Thermoplasmatota archaeon]|nr:hypothetical protein [Candidatus Thermoplasmatota archaeon]